MHALAIGLQSRRSECCSSIVFDCRAKPRLSAVAAGRRSYTEDELQAALRDIQSGKLGTRRAAVIYGIPRSTLRNKVYKLSQERRDFAILDNTKDDDDDDDDRDLSEEERETEKMLMSPLTMADVMRLTVDNRRAMEAWQQLLVHHRPLPDLLRNMVDEDRLAKMTAAAARPGCSTSDKELQSPSDQSGVILKVPSFRPVPKNNGSDTSSPAGPRSESNSPPVGPPPAKNLALSLREVITNSMNTKFVQDQPPLTPTPPVQPMDFRRSDQTVIRNHNNNHLEEKKLSSSNKGASNSQQANAANAGGKGTRPKRGKYRNYDRDSLVEAVRAVQRGEMSVHRAGSYYGVPHSTLEYKVKERHLMRPRKREPKPQPQTTSSSTSDESTKRKEDLEKRVAAANTRPQRFTPPSPLPPTPNGLKMPTLFDPALAYAHGGAPFPFWPSPTFAPLPLDYPRPDLFAATQMMQRLHSDEAVAAQQTLNKTTREIAESLYDGTGENGSFLDGIIRSSLETGLPPGREMSKALLEQLCRGGNLMTAAAAAAAATTRGSTSPQTTTALSLLSGVGGDIMDIKRECKTPASSSGSASPTTISATSAITAATIKTESRESQDLQTSATSPDRPSSASCHTPEC